MNDDKAKCGNVRAVERSLGSLVISFHITTSTSATRAIFLHSFKERLKKKMKIDEDEDKDKQNQKRKERRRMKRRNSYPLQSPKERILWKALCVVNAYLYSIHRHILILIYNILTFIA